MSADVGSPRETYIPESRSSGLEDGILKGALAFAFGLAAVLLIAPIARADFRGGMNPYRHPIGLLATHDDVKPAADENDDHEGHDEEGNDTPHDEDGQGDADDDHGSDNETGDDNSGSGPTDGKPPVQPPEGPSTASLPGTSPWALLVLLLAIAGAAAGTAFVLRRRRMRAR
jgi:hypothetical protein